MIKSFKQCRKCGKAFRPSPSTAGDTSLCSTCRINPKKGKK